MAYEDGDREFDEFYSQLAFIEQIINENCDSHIILGGDFNADFNRKSCNTDALVNFCKDLSLMPDISHPDNRVDYSFSFNDLRFNTLDHFILSGTLFETACLSIDLLHDGANLSNHEIVTIKLNLNSDCAHLRDRNYCKKISWYNAKESHLAAYQSLLERSLQNIIPPLQAITCNEPLCTDACHSSQLNQYARTLTDACLAAAESSIPLQRPPDKRRLIAGWSEFVEPARGDSIFWHKLWIACGRPRNGVVADIMRRTRASHYAIRKVKRAEKDIIRTRFAEAVIGNPYRRNIWSEIKRLNGNCSITANSINGSNDPADIANVFADKYHQLYNCVSFDNNAMHDIRAAINDRIAADAWIRSRLRGF